MSSGQSAEEYPNQLLGVETVNDTNAGAVNAVASPLKLNTAGGATGAILNSGAGVPAIGGNVGDLYLRTDGSETTYFYRCTVAGAAGAAGSARLALVTADAGHAGISGGAIGIGAAIRISAIVTAAAATGDHEGAVCICCDE